MSRSLWRSATASLLVACGVAYATVAAPSRPASETLFGVRVDDPYRNFENPNDPRVARWMKAQAAHAHATLARIPGRAALLRALEDDDLQAPERVTQVTRVRADEVVYLRRAAFDEQFKLYRSAAGRESLLVDPGRQAINWYSVAPDGRHVAYGLSSGGTEAAVLHVLDVATGRPAGMPVTRADYGGVSWAPDGRSFVFSRLRVPVRPGASDKHLDSQMLLLRVGAPLASARPVFGSALPGLALGPADSPFVDLTADGRWAIGSVYNGVQRDLQALYVAPQASLLAGRPEWRRLLDASDQVIQVAYHADTLYLLSHRDTPRFEVSSLALDSGDVATVVPGSARVLTGIAAAADALYVEARDGSVKRLFKRGWEAGAALVEVALPVQGSFALNDDEGGPGSANPRLPGLLLELEGWTRARQIYAVAADGSVANTGLQPAGRRDSADDLEVVDVRVPSHDGALVPLSIVHRKDLRRDGRNPALLYGYASYGQTEEPYFSGVDRAWLDAGGLIAVANPRGSGVFGEDWYRAGFQASKPNSWRDFNACAEYLIRERYSAPDRLAAWGVSAGGLLVGRAMTQRPDLYAAVLIDVGALDMVRAEDEPNGPPNVAEFGTRTTEAGLRALLEMSTYHHIERGVKYPAVLLSAGVNDPRVAVWNSTKTAARLMAATASTRPVLLRLDYAAGHGVGNSREQDLALRADQLAFLLWQMGVEGYQPQEEQADDRRGTARPADPKLRRSAARAHPP